MSSNVLTLTGLQIEKKKKININFNSVLKSKYYVVNLLIKTIPKSYLFSRIIDQVFLNTFN